jgi:hypothetical protein
MLSVWTSALLLSGCKPNPNGFGVPRMPVENERLTAQGEVTWTVDYDAETEAAGMVTDCTYTRTYALAEDRSAPWLCPDCDLHLVGAVEMSEPDAECYLDLTGVEPRSIERLGWSGDTLRRAFETFAPLVEAGTVSIAGDTVEIASDSGLVDARFGTATITSAGSLTLAVGSGDPMHGLTPPIEYACGWPAPDPPAYTGDYVLEPGAIVPDGLLPDSCDEGFRLHDIEGTYTILEISAADCAPCQSMASTADAGLAPLEEAKIDATVVTLLAWSLEAPLSPTPPALLDAWNDSFPPHGPVVGDRGWGFAVTFPTWGYEIVYPTWIVVDPDLKVLEIGQGFPGWEPIVDVILDDR